MVGLQTSVLDDMEAEQLIEYGCIQRRVDNRWPKQVDAARREDERKTKSYVAEGNL
jgi:hypothetical protein